MTDDIGFFYSCFKEKKAIDYSVKTLKEVYPNNFVYLVSDGGLDFSYLEKEYNNIKTVIGDDTMSGTFSITGGKDGTGGNFREEKYQKIIKKCFFTVINRLKNAIEFCEYPEWMVMLDPDALVRGKLTLPQGDAKLLGSRVNGPFPNGVKQVLEKIPDAIAIDRWGATPAVFRTEYFLKAIERMEEVQDIFNEFFLEFYAMYAHDVLIPLLFALIGIEEVKNVDLVECKRFSGWRNSQHPLIHQFKDYYE